MITDEPFKAYGFTFDDILALRGLLTVLGYMDRIPQFCEEVMQKGLPSMKEVGIRYHEQQIEKLKNMP
jgi:hypothetical protein